jgi:hypothetical protein
MIKLLFKVTGGLAIGVVLGLILTGEGRRILLEEMRGPTAGADRPDAATQAAPQRRKEGAPRDRLPSPAKPGAVQTHPSPGAGVKPTPRLVSGEQFARAEPGHSFRVDCRRCGQELSIKRPASNPPRVIWYNCRPCQRPAICLEWSADGSCAILPVTDGPIQGILRTGGMARLGCVHCGKSAWHPLKARTPRSRLKCSNKECGRVLAMVESDETGRRRTLPEYFTGKAPEEAVDWMDIWLRQLARFKYDHGKLSRRDPTWQSAAFTWSSGSGVCRDSATLLADWLRSKGYDARLAVGNRLKRGAPPEGHAWVVLIDPASGKQYLLESTGPTMDSRMRVPPLARLKTDYLAELQITPKGYLGRLDEGWTGDYEARWYATPHQTRP